MFLLNPYCCCPTRNPYGPRAQRLMFHGVRDSGVSSHIISLDRYAIVGPEFISVRNTAWFSVIAKGFSRGDCTKGTAYCVFLQVPFCRRRIYSICVICRRGDGFLRVLPRVKNRVCVYYSSQDAFRIRRLVFALVVLRFLANKIWNPFQFRGASSW